MNQSSAAQERQLILMERMNRRLDSIWESQKKLEETNSNLQFENTKLKNELAKQEYGGLLVPLLHTVKQTRS